MRGIDEERLSYLEIESIKRTVDGLRINTPETASAVRNCKTLLAHIANLENWKAEQIAVENEWDCQEVARELDMRPGSSIRKEIMPAIKAMKARIAELEQHIQDSGDDARERDEKRGD